MQRKDQTDTTEMVSELVEPSKEEASPARAEQLASEDIEPVHLIEDEEETSQPAAGIASTSLSPASPDKAFDWLAVGIVILVAAFFAVASRLHAQPPSSLTPAAVLSATGCGLFITAMRKLRTAQRPGLREAALAGLFLALLQFIAAISYPNLISTLIALPDEREGFLATWALVGIFSVVFSIVGATLGHLAFAPLRPLPANAKKKKTVRMTQLPKASQDDPAAGQDQNPASSKPGSRPRSFFSYFVAVLLLALTPVLAGYVFAAAFDYMLGVYHFLPGPYPTLRLLSALLPWQVPLPINLSNNPAAALALLIELWRIPLFLGNPTMFDTQALEPYIFNGAALALLLLTLRDQNLPAPATPGSDRPVPARWPLYLLLEGILGLVLVLPANLWIARGLEGLLRISILAIPIRTLYILNTLTFTLNLITGPLVCVGLAILIRFLLRRQLVLRRQSKSVTL